MRRLNAPRGLHALRFGSIVTIATLLALLDWATKHWVVKNFYLGESQTVLPWFYLTYVRNTGTAFGLFQDSNRALLIMAFIILGVLLYAARGLSEQAGVWGAVGVAFVLGGAIGNIYDRLVYGYVIDFLDFRIWPVFNIADSAITIGTGSLMIGLWRAKTPK